MLDEQATARIDLAKQRLRARLLARRRTALAALTAGGAGTGAGLGAGDAGGLAPRILALPEVARATCVAAYVGLPGEPELGDLLDRLLAAGTQVLLPTLRTDLDLDFRTYLGTLVPGALGTREPPSAAPVGDLGLAGVVIVPALAVDRRGRRLGRGGGSYDRALVRVAAQATVIAVVHDQELLDHVPTAPHDRGVHLVVTPSRILHCGPDGVTGEHPEPSTG
ncbi:5-formyltetrahydrofolate cyclo-ligase [Candidatus Frankia nodulisporulans]|uniref:5-formyltetrahydrofolate cyclo-ligase n=1 Tax=Candidatus Frankia nodulisporulans TaxID=2060052 RepID=UPI001CDD9083|nr:5-formyltetrahydrofolate cyclo-ligase [Candidatus Frankia nodulisporulans]